MPAVCALAGVPLSASSRPAQTPSRFRASVYHRPRAAAPSPLAAGRRLAPLAGCHAASAPARAPQRSPGARRRAGAAVVAAAAAPLAAAKSLIAPTDTWAIWAVLLATSAFGIWRAAAPGRSQSTPPLPGAITAPGFPAERVVPIPSPAQHTGPRRPSGARPSPARSSARSPPSPSQTPGFSPPPHQPTARPVTRPLPRRPAFTAGPPPLRRLPRPCPRMSAGIVTGYLLPLAVPLLLFSADLQRVARPPGPPPRRLAAQHAPPRPL